MRAGHRELFAEQGKVSRNTGYTAEGFAAMEKIPLTDHEIVQHAAKTPRLKVVFGTDAAAGAHGRSAEEFIDRVRDCGVDPMPAMVSATPLGLKGWAWAMRLARSPPVFKRASLRSMEDPLKDITAVRRVVVVMEGGGVYEN